MIGSLCWLCWWLYVQKFHWVHINILMYNVALYHQKTHQARNSTEDSNWVFNVTINLYARCKAITWTVNNIGRLLSVLFLNINLLCLLSRANIAVCWQKWLKNLSSNRRFSSLITIMPKQHKEKSSLLW